MVQSSVIKDVTISDNQAILVAHGWPSNPALLEADMAWLAARVESRLANWKIHSATLASPSALQLAIEASNNQKPLHVYPFFMSDGWFVTTYLRRRVSEIRSEYLVWHQPFGLSPALPRLCSKVLTENAKNNDFSKTMLIAVAHGSPDNPRPAAVARDLTQKLVEKHGFAASRNGFVDEAPYLAEVLEIKGPAICLPLFASQAGHVREDLATALIDSEFAGKVLPVIGTHREVPQLIADELARA